MITACPAADTHRSRILTTPHTVATVLMTGTRTGTVLSRVTADEDMPPSAEIGGTNRITGPNSPRCA
jgi:hypothetical protein